MVVGRYLSVLTSQLGSGWLAPTVGKPPRTGTAADGECPAPIEGSYLLRLSDSDLVWFCAMGSKYSVASAFSHHQPEPCNPSRNRLDNFKAPVRRMPGDWPLSTNSFDRCIKLVHRERGRLQLLLVRTSEFLTKRPSNIDKRPAPSPSKRF
ncbi:hypothetical protein I7I51_01409 [Histoplasma capsulatum]|uniref:Uncharacterized protein n=1 Tax=Ajellomyces capsulatus TaxID=5037 RepID=A0A8A1MIF2_AJECA|nr:hypothetical protein I7I51_01409 [Histoplasma capsulatum]